MTKRKGAVGDETKGRLLDAAQAVFLECGYTGASLRGICQKAGVTTGALYCFFKDKNALFEALLHPFAEGFYKIVTDHFRQEVDSSVRDDTVSRDYIQDFLDFRDANRDACALFLANPEHPYCIEIHEKLVALFSGQTNALLKRADSAAPAAEEVFNAGTIQWFSRVQVDMHLQVLRHPVPREEAARQMGIYARFLKGGFLELLVTRFPPQDPLPPL